MVMHIVGFCAVLDCEDSTLNTERGVASLVSKAHVASTVPVLEETGRVESDLLK